MSQLPTATDREEHQKPLHTQVTRSAATTSSPSQTPAVKAGPGYYAGWEKETELDQLLLRAKAYLSPALQSFWSKTEYLSSRFGAKMAKAFNHLGFPHHYVVFVIKPTLTPTKWCQ